MPADIYDEALAFCNRRLAEEGKPPITELPAGMPADASSCPCATAVPGVRVYCVNWHRSTSNCLQGDAPLRFVRFFDEHAQLGTLTLPVREPTA